MYCAIIAVVNALYRVIMKLIQKSINKTKVLVDRPYSRLEEYYMNTKR